MATGKQFEDILAIVERLSKLNAETLSIRKGLIDVLKQDKQVAVKPDNLETPSVDKFISEMFEKIMETLHRPLSIEETPINDLITVIRNSIIIMDDENAIANNIRQKMQGGFKTLKLSELKNGMTLDGFEKLFSESITVVVNSKYDKVFEYIKISDEQNPDRINENTRLHECVRGDERKVLRIIRSVNSGSMILIVDTMKRFFRAIKDHEGEFGGRFVQALKSRIQDAETSGTNNNDFRGECWRIIDEEYTDSTVNKRLKDIFDSLVMRGVEVDRNANPFRPTP
jgi:hypothetical protein